MEINERLKLELIGIIKHNNLAALKQRAHDNPEVLRVSLDNANQQAIHIAAGMGCFEIIEFLLETYPLLLNVVDHFYMTPLMHAASRGYVKIVQLLVGKQAKLDVVGYDPALTGPGHGVNALTLASNCGHEEVVKILICAGALDFINTLDEALDLLQQNQKNAGLILSNQKMMQILGDFQDKTAIDYQYKIAGRHPSFCLGIDWERRSIAVFRETAKIAETTRSYIGKFVGPGDEEFVVKKCFKKGGWSIAKDCDEINSILEEGRQEVHFMKKSYTEGGVFKHFFFKKNHSGEQQLYTQRMIMPLIRGKPALAVFNQRLPAQILTNLILLMTKELMSLHENGVIHGDIKMENILIWEDGNEVKFIDFEYSYAVTDPLAVVTSEVCSYWAPERTNRNTPLIPNTNQDIYSYGAMLSRIIWQHQSVLATMYLSIADFTQEALNTLPGNRPTLQSFHDALSAECVQLSMDTLSIECEQFSMDA